MLPFSKSNGLFSIPIFILVCRNGERIMKNGTLIFTDLTEKN